MIRAILPILCQKHLTLIFQRIDAALQIDHQLTLVRHDQIPLGWHDFLRVV